MSRAGSNLGGMVEPLRSRWTPLRPNQPQSSQVRSPDSFGDSEDINLERLSTWSSVRFISNIG